MKSRSIIIQIPIELGVTMGLALILFLITWLHAGLWTCSFFLYDHQIFNKLLLFDCEIWTNMHTVFFLMQIDTCGHMSLPGSIYVMLIWCWNLLLVSIYEDLLIQELLWLWKYLVVFLCADFGNLAWMGWHDRKLL